LDFSILFFHHITFNYHYFGKKAMPRQPKKTTKTTKSTKTTAEPKVPREEEFLLPSIWRVLDGVPVPLIIATNLRPGRERFDADTPQSRESTRETRIKLYGRIRSDVSVITTENCAEENVKLVIAKNSEGILELIVRAGIRTKKNLPTTVIARLTTNDGKALDVKLEFDSSYRFAAPKYVIDAAIIFGEWDFMDYLSPIVGNGIMEPSAAPDVLSGIPDVQLLPLPLSPLANQNEFESQDRHDERESRQEDPHVDETYVDTFDPSVPIEQEALERILEYFNKCGLQDQLDGETEEQSFEDEQKEDFAVVELKDQFVCNATFSDDFQNDPLLLCAN